MTPAETATVTTADQLNTGRQVERRVLGHTIVINPTIDGAYVVNTFCVTRLDRWCGTYQTAGEAICEANRIRNLIRDHGGITAVENRAEELTAAFRAASDRADRDPRRNSPAAVEMYRLHDELELLRPTCDRVLFGRLSEDLREFLAPEAPVAEVVEASEPADLIEMAEAAEDAPTVVEATHLEVAPADNASTPATSPAATSTATRPHVRRQRLEVAPASTCKPSAAKAKAPSTAGPAGKPCGKTPVKARAAGQRHLSRLGREGTRARQPSDPHRVESDRQPQGLMGPGSHR